MEEIIFVTGRVCKEEEQDKRPMEDTYKTIPHDYFFFSFFMAITLLFF
ncbi:MAG: hypothetical protein KKE53_03480 [Proteobacteria bacterium]|nr:hypothetical protein [Pseudomonadota bacterium]